MSEFPKHTRQAIVDKARNYLGTRFHLHGRQKGIGMDCVGLLICTAWDLGYEFKDDLTYTRDVGVSGFEEIVYKYSIPAVDTVPRNGQVLILRQSIFPMHTGILTLDKGKPMVINANMKKRTVVEDDFQDWARFLMKQREYPGVI